MELPSKNITKAKTTLGNSLFTVLVPSGSCQPQISEGFLNRKHTNIPRS